MQENSFSQTSPKKKPISISSYIARIGDLNLSKREASIQSRNSSKERSPNKSYTFKGEASVQGKTFPTSFVIGNMVNPIKEKPLHPYWGQQSARQLSQILGDESKTSRYIQHLQQQSFHSSEDVSYIYQILTLLLKKVKDNNPVIHKSERQSADSFQIEFNRNKVKIEQLKRQLSSKEKEIFDIQQVYKGIMRNYIHSLQHFPKVQEEQYERHHDYDD